LFAGVQEESVRDARNVVAHLVVERHVAERIGLENCLEIGTTDAFRI
jgi:hypothetical protein